MKLKQLALTVTLIALGGKGMAHEFWIDPLAFRIAPGAVLTAHLRLGTEFSGNAMSYLPRNFARFDVLTGSVARPVEGRLGDIPALVMADMPEGLAIVVHETTASRLTWQEWERFVEFVRHKDLGDPAALQADRGLDQEDVREEYTRFVKSLIAVGRGAGQDRRVGLRTEIVALANPYTEDLGARMPVQLWLDAAPRADAQVELFARAPDGAVTITLHRTDSDGIVWLPVQPGYSYMADAVVLEPMQPMAADDPEWLSLWANLTFAVPES